MAVPSLSPLRPMARRLADEHARLNDCAGLRRRLEASLMDPITIAEDPEAGEPEERVVFAVSGEDLRLVLSALSGAAA